MKNEIRYVHTNLIAKDWRKLADFYISVFGCKPLLPERDLGGEWIDKMTGISQVRVRGMHLGLPGYEKGPTLEIFEYEPEHSGNEEESINAKGFGHIAFHVDSVEEVLEEVIKHGGKQLGEVVKKEYEALGMLTAVYVTDPEGNFIELQNWKKQLMYT